MPEVELRLPVNALISYHYFANRDVSEMASWGLRLIGDSGAFSAKSQGAEINIDSFAEWGLKWKDSLTWVASLDVIGDKEASWQNYKHLRAAGLDAVPTIHYGCDPKEIDRYADEGIDFIGLGGMVGRKSEAQRLLRWSLSVFKYAKDNHPEMRFHGWGVTHNNLVMNLPWYSVDSSGFSSSYRFARLSLWDKSLAKNIGIDLNGKDIYKHIDLLKRDYNCLPEEVAVSNRETRRQLVRLSIASIQKQEDFLRRRHTVSAPKYGLNDSYGSAPNIHIASAAPIYMQEIADISISPTQGINIHNVIGRGEGPSMHVALGFPAAQSTISLSPTDTAPAIIEEKKG